MAEPENPSIREQAIGGGVWAFTQRASDRGLAFVRTLVLARLLGPEPMGVFGAAMICVSALRALTSVGVKDALIHEPDLSETGLHTGWTVIVLRGILIAGVVWLFAPWLAEFFKQERLVWPLRIVALAVGIGQLKSPVTILFEKRLDFRSVFRYRVVGAVADLAVGLVVGFVFRSVWALVAAIVARHAFTVAASYLIGGAAPRLSVDFGWLRSIFDYGRHMLGVSVVKFLALEGDDVIVGRLLGAEALGIYRMSYRISNTTATEVSNVINKVAFPLFTKIRDSEDGLTAGYLGTLEVTALVTVPVAGFMILFARDLVGFALGTDWLGMVPVLQVLAVLAAVKTIGAYGSLFKGVGRPDLLFRISAVRVAVMAVTIWPLTGRFELIGAALSILGATLFTEVWFYVEARRIVAFRHQEFLKRLFGPVLSTLLASATAYLAVRYADRSLVALAVGLITGGAAYFSGLALWDRAVGSSLIGTAVRLTREVYRYVGSLKGRRNA